MAFIRKKVTPSGYTIYQVVRSYREGRKVRQKVLASLGYDATIAAAIQTLETPNLYGWRRDGWARRKEELLAIQQQTGLP
jgi:hypothetical protein